MNRFTKWILKERNVWFHIILGFFTGFVWNIVYCYCKYCNHKNLVTKNISNNSKEISETNVFSCNVIIDGYKYECTNLINTCLYFDIIDKDDLYEGYSNTEIEELGLKVYECNDIQLPCEIITNYDTNRYEIVYTEHSNDYYFGYIDEENGEKLFDIINNKYNQKGGIILKGGNYKTYDYDKSKVTKGKDEYIITLVISYTTEP